ncbi:hypothetical protein AB1Y20_010201 [Prymnesium parvum]|uniref:Uncharacterized protein n=1 Tax=Prymnesium parvum TaxID=97485 RepID=A0AB34K6H0_PRYPA
MSRAMCIGWLAMAATCTAVQPVHGRGVAHAPRPPAVRRSCRETVSMVSEMEWRKRQQLSDQARAAAAAEEDAKPVAREESPQPNLATSVDDMNFFGAIGGGKLTRESIKQSTKLSSPYILAEEALQEAVRRAGQLPPVDAMQLLQECIGNAYEANVSIQSPQMKVAAALLATLENAAAMRTDGPASDPYGEQLNQLFADEYSIPALDDDLQ